MELLRICLKVRYLTAEQTDTCHFAVVPFAIDKYMYVWYLSWYGNL